jgi:hypothetical protein
LLHDDCRNNGDHHHDEEDVSGSLLGDVYLFILNPVVLLLVYSQGVMPMALQEAS